MSSYGVIIIGAGFGGLSIGALLARRGHRVLICEQSTQPGGRARSEERDGYIVDYGLHVHRFGDAGPAAKVLRRVGKPIKWAESDKAEKSLVQFTGRLYPRPDSIGGYLTTPMLRPLDRLRLLWVLIRVLRARPADWYGRSWADFIRRTTRSPAVLKLCRLFACAIIATDIETADAGEVIYFMQAALKAPRITAMPLGGTRQVIEKLCAAIEEQGGEIRTRCRVEHIIVEEGKVVGVETGDGPIRGRAVVYTPPIQHLFSVVDEALFPPEFRAYVRGLEPTSGLVLDFGLRERVSDLTGSVINLDDAHCMMGSFPSNLDPGLAPPGKQLATFLIIVPAEKVRERPYMENAAARLRRWIERTFPALSEAIEWERQFTVPILDGVYLKVGQAYPHRHSIASSHVRGLFFVGDTVGVPGCSGDIAFAAALKAETVIDAYLNSVSPPASSWRLRHNCQHRLGVARFA